VAFSILALTLTVLLQIFATGLRNVDRSDDFTQAVLHAESLLARLGTDLAVTEGPSQGQFEDRFSWDMLIEPYAWDAPEGSPAAAVKPYQVTLKVFWEEATKRRSVSLTALRLVAAQP